jgi:integrase
MRGNRLWERAIKLDNVRVIFDTERCKGDAESYVLEKLEKKGIRVARPKTPGRSCTETGHPDFICFYETGREYVEVKYKKDHISAAQLKWMVNHPDRRVVIYCVEGAKYPEPKAVVQVGKERTDAGSTSKRVLTGAELQAMREQCRSKRDLAIFEFLRSTGCRPHEMLFTCIGDIDLEKGRVFLRKTKAALRWKWARGRRVYDGSSMTPRHSFFDEKAIESLASYIKERKAEGASYSDAFFTIDQNKSRDAWMVRRIVKRLAKDAEIPGWRAINPGTFRRSYAYNKLLAGGCSVADIKTEMGLSQKVISSWER